MKKIIFLFLLIFPFIGWSQLPYNFVKISNSPASSKYRSVEITRVLINMEGNEILVITKLHYYSQDPLINFNSELKGIEYPNYEKILKANNDEDHLCNPNNGLTVNKVQVNDSTVVWRDPLANVVTNPIGLFDFFKPLLLQQVSTLYLAKQNVTSEDQIYQSWNK